MFSFPGSNFIIFLEYALPLNSYNQIQNHLCLTDRDVLYLYEDRWWYNREVIQERIMSRLKCFRSIFARKCKILSGKEFIKENDTIICVGDAVQSFLDQYHAYGAAKSKYRYALVYENRIVAVASFSQPRPMARRVLNPFANIPHKEMKTVKILDNTLPCGIQYSYNDVIMFNSYEWVRYASLPNIRVVGGMGKIMNAFLYDIGGKKSTFTELMTYSDNEWSTGEVYQKLGFTLAGERAPVEYYVCSKTHERLSERKLVELYNKRCMNKEKIVDSTMLPQSFLCDFYKINNKGSRKFLIQQPMLPPRSSLYLNED